MKNKKSIILALVAVLLFSLATIGCGQKVEPKESAQAYWDIFVKSDMTNIAKTGVTQDEAQKNIDGSIDKTKDAMRKQLLATKMTASDDQIDALVKAVYEVGKKATVQVEEVSNDGKTAQVKYVVNYVDLKTLYTEAGKEAVAEAQQSGLTSQKELMAKYSELYFNKVTERLASAEAGTETVEKTVDFVKEKDAWVPKDKENFISIIVNLATNS